MAAKGGGDRLAVNCGVRLDGNEFVLSYDVGDNVDIKKIQWDWHKDGDNFVAKLEAPTKRGDVNYHCSAAIDAETHSKLEKEKKPSKLESGKFYVVKLKKKKSTDVPDLKQFFNVPQ